MPKVVGNYFCLKSTLLVNVHLMPFGAKLSCLSPLNLVVLCIDVLVTWVPEYYSRDKSVLDLVAEPYRLECGPASIFLTFFRCGGCSNFDYLNEIHVANLCFYFRSLLRYISPVFAITFD